MDESKEKYEPKDDWKAYQKKILGDEYREHIRDGYMYHCNKCNKLSVDLDSLTNWAAGTEQYYCPHCDNEIDIEKIESKVCFDDIAEKLDGIKFDRTKGFTNIK